MKRFAVFIAGCGVYDGAEIHETVLTMLAIDRRNATCQLFAPDIAQAHVVNHLNGDVMAEQRNVLAEAARIARGNIKPVSAFSAGDFDALVLPGGFGVAKNMCNYAFKGAGCVTNPDIANAVRAMHKAGKPIGAMCIAPVLIANVLAPVEVTIGNDLDTASDIRQMGAIHRDTQATQVIVDKNNKVFSTPCYMLNSSISEIADGCQNLIDSILNTI